MAVLFVAALAAPLALAQGAGASGDPTIYPDLNGDELAAALASTYAPTSTYGYDRARDTLFAAVYMEPSDSLRGFYSGHAVWIDPALDPTTAAWNATPRYSTEHLWPENRGATEGTDAHKDMHHLAPVMQSVNSSRSDHPFAEIEDAEADRWWGPDGETRTAPPPLATRDLYTEKRNGSGAALEPREDRAGDIARSMFYVWAVYGPSGADQLDAEFWEAQRSVLLDWHAQDPPDGAEIGRTRAIEQHQGTPNPFVLDATLAARAFGPPPVQVALASFTAAATAGGARVEWATAAEDGIAAFRIDGRADVFGSPWEAWAATAAHGQPSAYVIDVAGAPSGGPLVPGAYRVGVTAIDVDGAEIVLGDVGLTIETPTRGEDGPDRASFALAPPRPNPADGHTAITLTTERPVHALAVVYDALGREALVAFDRVAVGRVEVVVDTTALPPGMYVLRVISDRGDVRTSRFTVVR